MNQSQDVTPAQPQSEQPEPTEPREQPTPSAPGDQPGNLTPQGNEAALYQLAISMSKQTLRAGALHDSLMWVRQAESIGMLMEEKPNMPEVTRAYVELILHSTLTAQELALVSGNILRKHGQLADITEKAAEHLVVRMQTGSREIPRAVALIVQGYARQLRARVHEFLARDQVGVTSAHELEGLLDCLSSIAQYADQLTNMPEDVYQPFGKKIDIATTAVSNARYQLGRFLPSDWAKAEIFCRRAYLLLTSKSITQAGTAPSSGDAYLDSALRTFPSAHQALLRRDYKQSAAYLRTVLEALQKAQSTRK